MGENEANAGIKCYCCEETKLSMEYPRGNILPCHHPLSMCMRCFIKKAETYGYRNCPFQECKTADVDQIKAAVERCQSKLDYMFGDKITRKGMPNEEAVWVMSLTGNKMKIPFNKSYKISDLVKKLKETLVKEEMSENKGEQKQFILSFHGKQLDTTSEVSTFETEGITAGDIIQMKFILKVIGLDLDIVCFDIKWKFTGTSQLAKKTLQEIEGRIRELETQEKTWEIKQELAKLRNQKEEIDKKHSELQSEFLDAICFVTMKNGNILSVDRNSKEMRGVKEQVCITHTGDKIFAKEKTISQNITFFLKNFRKDVTNLILVASADISADEGNTLSAFDHIDISITSKDKSTDEKKPICDTSIAHAKSFPAVILCIFTKQKSGWQIIENGLPTLGNSEDYGPIEENIRGYFQ